jgi:hypothetical protein
MHVARKGKQAYTNRAGEMLSAHTQRRCGHIFEGLK